MKKTIVFLFLAFSVSFAIAQAPASAPPPNPDIEGLKVRPGTRVQPATAVAQAAPAPTVTDAAPASTATLPDGTVLDYNEPATFFNQGIVGLLEAGVVAILALLGGFIPGLRNLKNGWVRSGVVIFVALTGLATFKAGALTEEFFTLLSATFLPNFGATNFVYSAVRGLLKLIGVEPKVPRAPAANS